jgi:hypothetical protein
MEIETGEAPMSLRPRLAACSAAIFMLASAGAHATVFFSGPSSMAPMATDQSFDVSFNAGSGGLAGLSFVLDGTRSLDGLSFYEDDFTLSLNNVAILSGTFNLGGGGSDAVFFAPVGATIDDVTGIGTAITWTGGHVNIATPLTLAAGVNTLTFGYTSRTSSDGYYGFQALGDEGWATHDVLVTSDGTNLAGDIPEPASWALMLLGFGGLGAMLRRSRLEGLAGV